MHLTNLVVPASSDWGYSWPLLGEDGVTPLDTDGWSASGLATTWDPETGSVIQARWSSTPATGEGLLDLGDSALTLFVASEMSADWRWVLGQYELSLVDPSGRVDRTIGGRMTVDRSISPVVA
ncbi:hypothetical protein [Actinomycetospora sp. CA-053990]|uniref:hypothetical protein n=1 Tax=Actinomycetospora sp. CA-053990 TaxID=3239891 RepID=UPI003D8EDB07